MTEIRVTHLDGPGRRKVVERPDGWFLEQRISGEYSQILCNAPHYTVGRRLTEAEARQLLKEAK